MRFTIGKRLGLGFFIVSAGLVGIVALNWFYSDQAKTQAQLVQDETAVFTLKAKDMQFYAVQVQQWLTDISATRGQDGLNDGFEQAETNAAQFKQGLEDFRKMYTEENDQESLASLDTLEEEFDGYYEMGKQMAAAYIKDGPQGGNPFMEKFDPYAAQITDSMNAFVEDQTKELNSAMTAIVTGATTTIQVGTISGIVLVVFSIVIAWLVTRSITLPVKQVADVLDIVAGGDYSQKSNVTRNDELGQMSASLNTAIDATAQAMQDVKDAAEREKQAQAERAEQEREAAEIEQNRKEEEAEKERQLAEAEQKRRQEQADQEREQAEQEAQKAEILRGKVDGLLQVVSAAAEGDLTRQVTVEGDEAIDELAGGIKQMLGDLSNVIGQVTESAAQFTEGSRVIAESSQTLASGAQTQSSSVEEVSASVEELNASIDGVKTNAAEADAVAKKTNALAEQGGQAVQKSIEAMELIRNSSDQIAEIIQVISEIASQTNLLALNAAIEAARAGEHGMGFAVVADEVRKLAERSNQAAGEITSLIKESSSRVQEGAQLSDETGNSLKEIIEGVEATVSKITEIATATIEQASNAGQVAEAIQGISQVTEQAAAGSEEMASSSEELGAQASALQSLVGRFKTDNSSITRSTTQVEETIGM